ncbi:MAG TPA: hypothetical protein PK076_07890 [Saprospiraceae bacterium]|nr:hypothetical protein [Saprospiraceae bacterium]HQW56032.1 hypothetical protein [Saprospiraceae bacterium]
MHRSIPQLQLEKQNKKSALITYLIFITLLSILVWFFGFQHSFPAQYDDTSIVRMP